MLTIEKNAYVIHSSKLSRFSCISLPSSSKMMFPIHYYMKKIKKSNNDL